jgi:hypothetical protein
VILKNTSVVRDAPPSSSTTSINRSMSLLTTNNNRIPILAPPRGERARLEALLSDVWTHDVLPFPGITARSRGEYLVKASATSMMRKLSVASITGSFGRRSHSQSSSSFGRTDSSDEPAAGVGPGRRQARSDPIPRGTDTARSSVLSSIPDECYPQVESEWGIDVLRTVGQVLADAKRQRDETDGDAWARPLTPGSKRLKRTFSASKKTRSEVYVSEKENAYVSPKRNGRWNKVGALRGEAVVRGIRSLFQ